MPIYVYNCNRCGYSEDEFQHIQDAAFVDCPACGRLDTYHRIVTLPHTDMKAYHKPIELHSIGLAHSDEIEAFQRRNPDTPISTDINDPLYGVPVVRSRKEKLKVLSNEGFEEKK